MDGKRRKFARFYFVSEADLLDILSNGSQPKMIMKHVDKVLLYTKALVLDESKKGRPWAARFIAGVGSEEADFEPNVPLEGKVEVYLQDVLHKQKDTLRCHLSRCYKRYPTMDRHKWVNYTAKGSPFPEDAAQIILLVAGMYYVKEVEHTMVKYSSGDKTAMDQQLKLIIDQLRALVSLTRTKLKSGERKRVMCMITLDAHSRDIFAKLIAKKAYEVTHFEWMSQLKQRFIGPTEEGDRQSKTYEARVDILNASFLYDFEYLGNGSRLVVTPLTDRIYVTAT